MPPSFLPGSEGNSGDRCHTHSTGRELRAQGFSSLDTPSSFLQSNVGDSTELVRTSESCGSHKDNPCNELSSMVEPSNSGSRHLRDLDFFGHEIDFTHPKGI